MFGRMSFVSGSPERIDDLLAYAHDNVKPATDLLPGNLGLGAWVNRETGEALVMTVWQDEETLRASEESVLKLRESAAELAGGTVTVERYEATLIDSVEPHQVGYVMRLVRMDSDPRQLDENQAWARDHVLPAFRAQAGYVSYVVEVDRRTGAVAAMSTFRDRTSADAALTATQRIRDAAAGRGMTIRDVRNYEVALVGIRGPAPKIPAQTTVDLTAEQRQHAGR